MRTNTVIVGIILLFIGIILISTGQMIEDASQHSYDNFYQNDETRQMKAIGKITILGGFGISAIGLLISFIGVVEPRKRTKVEKLQAKVDEKILKDKLKKLNIEREK